MNHNACWTLEGDFVVELESVSTPIDPVSAFILGVILCLKYC